MPAPEPSTYAYKTVGHCLLKADVYRPPGTSRPCPALVWIHGGCLMYGSRRQINPLQLELYLEAGYALVAIDYRLAPESRLPLIARDLEDAFHWIHAQARPRLGIDPERLAVVGHSAGGYLALLAGHRAWPPPRAIVSFYGYGDIVGDWYSKPDPFYCRQPAVSPEEAGLHVPGPVLSEPYPGRGKDKYYLYCRQHGLWPRQVGGVDPEQDPAFFAPYCPLRNVGPSYPPTLLLHGDRDTDVPYEQSALMAGELARCGIEHCLFTIAGGPHGFDGRMDEQETRAAFAKTLAFLAEHTAPRP